jgi:hypothetical protein
MLRQPNTKEPLPIPSKNFIMLLNTSPRDGDEVNLIALIFLKWDCQRTTQYYQQPQLRSTDLSLRVHAVLNEKAR